MNETCGHVYPAPLPLMTKPLHLISVLALAALPLRAQLGAEASFRGSLPPAPVAALSAEQEALIEKELAAVTLAFAEVMKHERAADADIFLKAVRYALEFDEWYDAKPEDGVKKALALLAEAQRRMTSAKAVATCRIRAMANAIPSPLPLCTIESGAAGLDNALNAPAGRCSGAAGATLALAAIDLEGMLEIAQLARGLDIVAQA